MLIPCMWNIDQTMILTRTELGAVLADLSDRSRRSLNARLTLAVVRLACCCGLRASEIAALRLGDVRVGVDRPHLRIRPGVGKGGRARTVPLWWDAGTLADLTAWKAQRQRQGAGGEDLFVCSMLANRRGRALSRHALRLRFQRACRALGPERARRTTIHHGRHTFVSHSLAGGRTLAEVRDAAGHSHVGVTSLYLHVAVEDDAAVGDLFRFRPSPARGRAGGRSSFCRPAGRRRWGHSSPRDPWMPTGGTVVSRAVVPTAIQDFVFADGY